MTDWLQQQAEKELTARLYNGSRLKSAISTATIFVFQLMFGLVLVSLAAMAGLFIIPKISVDHIHYECDGTSQQRNNSGEFATRLFMKMDMYKSPISMFMNSSGQLNYEASNKAGIFIAEIDKGNNYVLLRSGKSVVGGYSFISRRIDINVGDTMTFTGFCREEK